MGLTLELGLVEVKKELEEDQRLNPALKRYGINEAVVMETEAVGKSLEIPRSNIFASTVGTISTRAIPLWQSFIPMWVGLCHIHNVRSGYGSDCTRKERRANNPEVKRKAQQRIVDAFDAQIGLDDVAVSEFADMVRQGRVASDSAYNEMLLLALGMLVQLKVLRKSSLKVVTSLTQLRHL